MQSDIMKQKYGEIRDWMKTALAGCTEEQRDVFRRMYNHEGKHAHDVDGIPDSKLSWACVQIENTVKKNKARKDLADAKIMAASENNEYVGTLLSAMNPQALSEADQEVVAAYIEEASKRGVEIPQ